MSPLLSQLLTLFAGLLIGIGAGYVLFQNLERRKTGGKTAAQLKEEHEQYREQVQQHFTKTSDLFQNVTMQYRELYDHLANGAQSLCQTIPATPALDLSDKALLPDTDASRSGTGAVATNDRQDRLPEDEPTGESDDDIPTARGADGQDDAAMGADASVAVDTEQQGDEAGQAQAAEPAKHTASSGDNTNATSDAGPRS